MGFWNKLGKIALTAAPYVAAPFTGGASLAATGLANKAVQKWSQKDAAKAEAQGLAPSNFDKVLGKVGGYAALGSMFVPGGQLGALGKAGSTGAKLAGAGSKLSNFQKVMGGVSAATGGSYAPKSGGDSSYVKNSVNDVANRVYGNDLPSQGGFGGNLGRNSGGGWQDALGSILGGYGKQAMDGGGGGYSRQPTPDYNAGAGQAVSRGLGPVMPRGGYRYNENPMNQLDQSNPNLSQSIFQGRQEAIRNQPFRSGYDVKTLIPGSGDEEDTIFTNRMPPIYPTGGGGRRRRPQAAQ